MKKKSLNDLIISRNERWDKADTTEKKMLICKDVIAMLNTQVINVSPGVYCETRDFREDASSSKVQEGLLEENVSCTVCARGAMMISKFRFTGPGSINIKHANNQVNTLYALSEAFTNKELNMIESIFEGGGFYEWSDAQESKFHKSFTGYSEQGNGDENDADIRLRELMERIIYHKGDVKKAITCGRIDKQVAKLISK